MQLLNKTSIELDVKMKPYEGKMYDYVPKEW